MKNCIWWVGVGCTSVDIWAAGRTLQCILLKGEDVGKDRFRAEFSRTHTLQNALDADITRQTAHSPVRGNVNELRVKSRGFSSFVILSTETDNIRFYCAPLESNLNMFAKEQTIQTWSKTVEFHYVYRYSITLCAQHNLSMQASRKQSANYCKQDNQKQRARPNPSSTICDLFVLILSILLFHFFFSRLKRFLEEWFISI